MSDKANDTSVTAFKAILVLRNAFIRYSRSRLEPEFGADLDAKIKDLFQKEWPGIERSANELAATGEVSSSPRDALDHLSIGQLATLIGKYWEFLCPTPDPRSEVNKKVKARLMERCGQLTGLRNSVSHSPEEPLSILESLRCIDTAILILGPLQLPEADQLREMWQLKAHQWLVDAGPRATRDVSPIRWTGMDRDVGESKLTDCLETGWPAPHVIDVDLDIHFGLGSSVTPREIPPYVHRTQDGALADRLNRALEKGEPADWVDRIVIAAGPNKAGITRSVLELLRREVPDRYLLIAMPPSSGATDPPDFGPRSTLERLAGSLDNAEATGLLDSQVVIFVEDLHLYFGSQGTRNIQTCLERLLKRPNGPILAATMSDQRLSMTDEAAGRIGVARAHRDLLRKCAVEFSSEFDSEEEDCAFSIYGTRIAHRLLDLADLHRLPERLAAVTELLPRMVEAERDLQAPHRWALVLALCDAAITDPQGVDRPRLQRLTAVRFSILTDGNELTEGQFEDALNWARIPVGKTSAILKPDEKDQSRWRLMRELSGRALANHTVHEKVLQLLDERQFDSLLRYEYLKFIDHRYQNDDAGYVMFLARTAHGLGSSSGTFLVGLLLHEEYGDLEEAKELYSEALVAEYPFVHHHMGELLERQGNMELAEFHHWQAVMSGDTRSLSRLCWIFELRGDFADADLVWPLGQKAGNAQDICELAIYQRGRGLDDRADLWLQKSAEADAPSEAWIFLAYMHLDRGELKEAEHCLRKECGPGGGNDMEQEMLGRILRRQGEFVEAEGWLRKSAEGSNEEAAIQLGILFEQQGQRQKAVQWFMDAIEEVGHGSVMKACIGALLSKQGDLVGAQSWYRQAIDEDGDGDIAMRPLALLLDAQGELEEAKQWYLQAIEHDDDLAMRPLALLLNAQGDSEGAGYWNQRVLEAPPPPSDSGHYNRESHRLLLQELIDI